MNASREASRETDEWNELESAVLVCSDGDEYACSNSNVRTDVDTEPRAVTLSLER